MLEQNPMTKKQIGKERVLFSLYFHMAAPHQRKSGQEHEQGRILEGEADEEAMEE